MIRSLSGKLDACPLCQGEWHQVDDADYSGYLHFKCANKCGLDYMYMGLTNSWDRVWLRKKFPALETSIWWCNELPCRLQKLPVEKYHFAKDLSFVLPFDIDEERLQLLLVFS